MTETAPADLDESIRDLTWTLEGALNRAEFSAQEMDGRRTFPAEYEVLALVAKDLRTVRAHKELRDAILSEPHHRWPGVSTCLKATFPEVECACGRDERVARLLGIIAAIYEEPTT